MFYEDFNRAILKKISGIFREIFSEIFCDCMI